jgi:hypothetical protein
MGACHRYHMCCITRASDARHDVHSLCCHVATRFGSVATLCDRHGVSRTGLLQQSPAARLGDAGVRDRSCAAPAACRGVRRTVCLCVCVC